MNARPLILAVAGLAAAVPLFGQPPTVPTWRLPSPFPAPVEHLGPFPPPLAAADQEKLIARLDSSEPAERAEALRRLAQAPEAADLLRKAAEKNPGAGVRVRAEKALAAVTDDLARKRLARLGEYAKNRQVDRLIETMVYWRESLVNDDRDAPRTLTEGILDVCYREFKDDMPKLTFHPGINRLRIGTRLPRVTASDCVAETLDDPRTHSLGHGFGVVRDKALLSSSDMCFVNGDVSIRGGVRGLLVCNGNVRITRAATYDVVILCTGDLSFDARVDKCLLVAGGEIKFDPDALKKAPSSEFEVELKKVAGDAIKFDKSLVGKDARLRSKEKKLAEVIKLYDCRAGGLEVADAGKEVRVTASDPAGPFGKAGFQKDDVIERLDGFPVPDVRTLNKLLCRATIGATGEALVRVRRGGGPVHITVRVPD